MFEYEIASFLFVHVLALLVLSVIVGCGNSKRNKVSSSTSSEPDSRPPRNVAPSRSKLSRVLGRSRKKTTEEQSSSALTVVENPIATHLKGKSQPHIRGIFVKQAKAASDVNKSGLNLDETQRSMADTSISRRSLMQPTQASPDDDDSLWTQEVSDYRTYASELSETEEDPARTPAKTPHDESVMSLSDSDSSVSVSQLSAFAPSTGRKSPADEAYVMKAPSSTTPVPSGSLARPRRAGVPPPKASPAAKMAPKRCGQSVAVNSSMSNSPRRLCRCSHHRNRRSVSTLSSTLSHRRRLPNRRPQLGPCALAPSLATPHDSHQDRTCSIRQE